MALSKCPRCGQEVSDKATKCVHCGLVLKPANKARLNASPQQLFDEACKYYKDLVLTIKEVGLALENVRQLDYSTEVALKQMDWTLQYLLLIQALEDGELEPNESIFIDQITDYGDLMGYINDKYDTNFSWESLELLNNKLLVKIIEDIHSKVLSWERDFINYFALVDAATPGHDYYEDIRVELLNIFECLSLVNGDNSNNNGDELFNTFFGEYYLDTKRKYEKDFKK